jgi:hypothetical protein
MLPSSVAKYIYIDQDIFSVSFNERIIHILVVMAWLPEKCSNGMGIALSGGMKTIFDGALAPQPSAKKGSLMRCT